MEHKHTPGPWLVATSNSWRRIVSQHGDVVCAPCNQPDGHPDLTFPNGGAEGSDARLIASAPELLEALNLAELFMSGFEGDSMQVEIEGQLRKIRAAIAKATGA